ncbi:MAG: hypothetical protein HYS41_03930, partial [Candidatus Omnitrophica bacterium]|nr:hypothetical protein [Candidatus Omnitrophota bacterium]
MSPEWMSNWRERSGWSLAARGTAALTVFCFVLTQLPLQVFAQHPELPEWLKEEQGGWVSAEQAQRLHKADAELLTFLSTLEQSKERLVTASASGIQTLHAGGQPVVSRDTANNLLFKPTVEIASPAKEQGGLAMTGTETISGTLLLADSTLQDIKEGRIVRKVDPFGTETFFDVSERPLYEIAPDGTRTDYGYVIASPPEAGEAISFSRTAHLATGDLTQRFDAQGRLTELSYPDGKAFFYTEGRLASARVNGATFLYTHAVSPDGSVTATLEGGQGADLPRRLIYDSDGSLQEVLQADGTLTRFLQGVPTEVIAPDGTTTQYKVSGTGVDFLATRQQVERRYDSTGLLTGLTLADQTRLTIVNDRLETIQLPDGSTITDGVFDADSRVVSGTVTLPNGRQVRYLEGQPTEALLPDGTTIGYTNGQPSLLNLPSGLSYTLTHESDRWLATLTQTVPPNNVADPPSTVAEPDTDLTPPDPYTTALTLTRALEDGTIAQYERQALGGQSPAGTVPWTLTQLVIASTSETGEAISQVITSPQDPAFKERYDPDPPPPPPTYSELLEPNHSLSPINDVGAAPG